MRPGRTVILERSMTVAPVGTVKCSPTDSIFPARTKIIWLVRTRPESTSMNFPARMTVICGVAGDCWAELTAAEKIKKEARKAICLSTDVLSRGGRRPGSWHGRVEFRPALQHLPQDVLQDAAVMIVGNFFGGIRARDDGERRHSSVRRFRVDRDLFFGREGCDA